jgi:hypothetical protein
LIVPAEIAARSAADDHRGVTMGDDRCQAGRAAGLDRATPSATPSATVSRPTSPSAAWASGRVRLGGDVFEGVGDGLEAERGRMLFAVEEDEGADPGFAPGHDVDVFVNPDPSEHPSTAITAARRILARFREREPEYRRWSAAQLHAERWNTDEPMTSEDVAQLLRVACLEFRSDGGFQIYWNDQDRLFWGHNVFTEVGPDGECVASDME